jgi:hypothetical protein
MAVGLRALNRVASSQAIDRLGLRDPAVKLLHHASRTTGRTASRAGRTFAAAQRLSRPVRQPHARSSDLFDLTPTDEQQLLRDTVSEFALSEIREAAPRADDACAAPPSDWPTRITGHSSSCLILHHRRSPDMRARSRRD